MEMFLAAPYMQYFTPATGVELDFQDKVLGLVSAIQRRGVTVLSAFVRENWIADVDNPADAVDYDFRGISRAEFVMAFLENDNPSYGVLVEIGYAAALKKRLYIISRMTQAQAPYLVTGLSAWTEAIAVEYTDDDDLYRKIDTILDNELCQDR